MPTLAASLNSSVSASTTVLIPLPVGSVIAFATTTVPDGWLPCDGRQISQSQYPALFGVIGGTIPDLRSRFLIGVGNGPGLSGYGNNQKGGEENHTLSVNEMPGHTHSSGIGGGNRGGSVGTGNSEGWASTSCAFSATTTSTGNGGGHNNLPPYFALTYIIKF